MCTRKTINSSIFLFLFFIVLILGCSLKSLPVIDYEKYVLDNGLEVILHEDRSDPIVAIAVYYHVGSSREEKYKTGLAHLFEHMMIHESQHVGSGPRTFINKFEEVGGVSNATASKDRTCYWEVFPNDALEMALWMEADRMGWILGGINQKTFANEINVVLNEKRQLQENRPYGYTDHIIYKSLYPEDHPYNHITSGSTADLRNATLEDVKNFYQKWYSPNNATLVIAGDFIIDQTKQWIEKYFGEIKSSPQVNDPRVRLIKLEKTKRVFHEDNFGNSPELNMVFPTPQFYDKDMYALDLLARLLCEGKKSPLYQVIVEEKKLAPKVFGYHWSQEIAGEFRIGIRTFPNKNLTEVENAVKEAFERFEKEGFTNQDLKRVKNKFEAEYYDDSLSSILGKAYLLAFLNESKGSPGFLSELIKNYQKVSEADVWRVFDRYLKNRHYVLTCLVPKGQRDLAAKNSERFTIDEEKIEDQSEEVKKVVKQIDFETIPSTFERSIEPPKGPKPELKIPLIWKEVFSNNLQLLGIEHTELPVVNFSIVIKGALLLEQSNQIGISQLSSKMLLEGTKYKTPIELQESFDDLGASVWISADEQEIKIEVSSLSANFEEVCTLIGEILIEPRWDSNEFERIKKETVETINQRESDSPYIAENVFKKLIYGKENILSYSVLGERERIQNLTIEDLKTYYKKYIVPSVSYISIVGDVSKSQALKAFRPLEKKWIDKSVHFPKFTRPLNLEESKVYFIDVPDAKQSQIHVGYLALAYTDKDFYPATVMNLKFGDRFWGILRQTLREKKGFTYAARAKFTGTLYPGPFVASSSVQSNKTVEAVTLFKELMLSYREGISEEDLAFVKKAIIYKNVREYETLGNLINMLNEIQLYDLPDNYIKKRMEWVENFTVNQHRELAQKYIKPNKMIYLIVGDARTQLTPLKELGYGNPILLDKKGNKIDFVSTF